MTENSMPVQVYISPDRNNIILKAASQTGGGISRADYIRGAIDAKLKADGFLPNVKLPQPR